MKKARVAVLGVALVALAAIGAVDASAASAGSTITAQLDCGNGVTAYSVAAPAGFDPRTATPEELTAADFPSRPDDPDLLSTWQAYAAAYAAGQVDQAPSCDMTSEPALPPAGTNLVPADGHGYASNWAGNVDHQGSYTDAEAQWRVPKATGGAAALASPWVGVGLGNSFQFPLAQAGTDSDGAGHGSVWWELYPWNTVQHLNGFGQVQGHVLFAHVTFTSNGSSAYHLVDETTGHDERVSKSVAGTAPDGHAEFIVERPGAALANFATVTFDQAQAASPATGWRGVGNLPHYWYSMTSDGTSGGRLLGAPGPISPNGYSSPVTWHAAS